MKVRADHVRLESLLYCWYSLTPRERTAAMTHIKDDTSLLCIEYKRFYFPIFVHHSFALSRTVGIGMCKNIARAKVLHEKRLYGIGRFMFAEVNHHWHIGKFACFDSLVDLTEITPVVGGFNSNKDIRIKRLYHMRRHNGVHIRNILLLKTANHAPANYVKQGKH